LCGACTKVGKGRMGLRAKLILSMVLVSAGLTIAALLAVRGTVRDHVREELAQSLEGAAVTFREVQLQREVDAQGAAELIANTPILQAVMTTRDPATIQDASGDLWNRAGTDLFA